jgi:hypothetical protein
MPHELEVQAQRAAELRLIEAEQDMWESIEREDAGEHKTAGWFCGCDTCIVREVLDAAWPYLYQLAHEPDTEPPA